MALTRLRAEDLAAILRAVPDLFTLPTSRFDFDYDEEADVLYLSFPRPQRATDSELRDDGVIVHRRGEQIVGLTILEASNRGTT